MGYSEYVRHVTEQLRCEWQLVLPLVAFIDVSLILALPLVAAPLCRAVLCIVAAGVTPLVAAATYGHTELATLLIEHGADSSVVVRGKTAREWAEARGFPETVQALPSHAA